MDGSENGAENDVEISVEEITSNGASLEQKIKTEQSPGSSPAREGISTPDHQAQAPVNISQFSANQMTAQVN